MYFTPTFTLFNASGMKCTLTKRSFNFDLESKVSLLPIRTRTLEPFGSLVPPLFACLFDNKRSRFAEGGIKARNLIASPYPKDNRHFHEDRTRDII